MRKVSREMVDNIYNWILDNGRKLEVERFKYHFKQGKVNDVLNELSNYKNEDGGFGHGIESDFWTPYSSPLASSVACKILWEIGFKENHKIIEDSLGYFENNKFNMENGTWQTVIEENNNYPHAPWWSYSEEGDNTWGFNPSMDIASFMFLHSYEGSKAREIAKLSLRKAEDNLLNSKEMNFHELICYINGITLIKDSKKQSNVSMKNMEEKIIELIRGAMCLDKSKWGKEYVAEPLDFIDCINGESILLYPYFKEAIMENAQVLIEGLNNNIWDITWNWGESYNDSFQVARNHWRGVLAVQRLIKLNRLGLIE